MARPKKTTESKAEPLFRETTFEGAFSGTGAIDLDQIKTWRETLVGKDLIKVLPPDANGHILVITKKSYWVTENPERPVIELNGVIFRAINLEREKEIITAL